MNKCSEKDLARFKRYRDRHPKRIALVKKKYWDNVLSSTIKGLCMRIRKDCKNRATKRKLEYNNQSAICTHLWRHSELLS